LMRILRNLAKIPKRNLGIDLHELVYIDQIYQGVPEIICQHYIPLYI
jgi:hypothetical protein